jgi:hypothetical protein
MIRLLLDQLKYFHLSQAMLQQGKPEAAITYLDRVMCAHIPFSIIEKKARDQIYRLGEEYLMRGELQMALLCYETIRSSLYQARHLFIPNRELLKFLNTRIAVIRYRLLMNDESKSDFESNIQDEITNLETDYSPPIVVSLFCILSFFCNVYFCYAWIWLRKKIFLIFSLLFLGSWIFLLYLL